MGDKIKLVSAIVFAVIVLSFAVWWNIYAYQDCKAVGHSTFYCVMRIGR